MTTIMTTTMAAIIATTTIPTIMTTWPTSGGGGGEWRCPVGEVARRACAEDLHLQHQTSQVTSHPPSLINTPVPLTQSTFFLPFYHLLLFCSLSNLPSYHQPLFTLIFTSRPYNNALVLATTTNKIFKWHSTLKDFRFVHLAFFPQTSGHGRGD